MREHILRLHAACACIKAERTQNQQRHERTPMLIDMLRTVIGISWLSVCKVLRNDYEKNKNNQRIKDDVAQRCCVVVVVGFVAAEVRVIY